MNGPIDRPAMRMTGTSSIRKEKVALIELGGSHAECLPTQIHYLKTAGYRVHLICDEAVWSQIEEKEQLAGVQVHKRQRNRLQTIATVLKIHRYFRTHKIDFMIVNTIEAATIRELCIFPFPKKLNATGVLHNAEKLTKGRTLRWIVGRRVKKFFVLSESIRQTYQPQTRYRLEAFYPVYFPKWEHAPAHKAEDEIWITVPGAVETQRRDYAGLLQGIKERGLRPQIKIIFLGKWDERRCPELAVWLEQAGAARHQILVFKQFLTNAVFHDYIRQSDLIAPLIHPSADNRPSTFYGNHRISGAFNLSFGYKIPMLIENSMSHDAVFKDTSFFYDANDLVDVINSFPHRKDELQIMRKAMANDARWQEENLLRKYIDFIRQQP
jgi:hypothetical protein